MSKVIGIDSGTGFSAMCVLEGGKAQVLTNKEGSRTTPSVVAWTKTGERLIGEAAKRQAVTNPKNTVYEFKRLMGRKYSEVKDELKYLSYDVVPGPNDECRVKVGDKLYSPEELTAIILRKLKEDAEAFLGEPVKEAIVTCPAYWNSDQRQCVKNAGTIAGLDVLRVINEPTAASLAYGLDKGGGKTIAVADSGAGTLDFTILEMNDGVFEVKSTSGDPRLGGKDYDDAIVEWLVSEFKAETGIDLSKDDMAKQRLKTEAEKAKIALSTSQSVEINLPFITADASGPKHLIKTLTLAKFEQLVSGLNDRYEAPAKKCLADSGKDKVDEVILVGGTTRIPSVQRKIKEIFGIEPSKSVNPDEAVAEGAAIQGGVIKGEVKDVLLLDVTPLTLGIETMGGVATPMIDRNTTIPTKKSNVFTTAADNQPCVTVRVCQGERPMFSDNKLLGSFNLDGIPPAPRGVPQVEVTFDIDANGILNVSAKDLGTGKEQKITITAASGLSKDDIERAKADAERNKEEDDRRAKLAAERNKADSLVFMTEKALKDAGGKAGEDEKKAVEEAVAKAREAVKGDDLAAIEAAVEGLNKANAAIAAKLYGSSGAPGGNFSAEDLEKMKNDPRFAELFKNGGPFGGQAAGGKNDDGAVDAEVVG